MPNLVQELNQLDFSVYIGGPLQAAVQAQHGASMSLVQFVEAIGFEVDPNDSTKKKLRYVDFEYSKSFPNPNYNKPAADLPNGTNVTDPFLSANVALKVPFLTMLQMPCLRIEEVTIDFNAKLTSTETANVSSEFSGSAELGVNYKVVNFKASASYKRTSSRTSTIEKTYNMGVHVLAVGDELPAGLQRILDMLEDSIAAANKAS